MKEIKGLNILENIASGGQKQVFKAEYNGKEVVYKIGKCYSETSLKRIIKEVEILRNIDSEYFPKNYYFNYTKNGDFAIIEEYIEGITSSQIINKYNTENEIISFLLEIINGMRLLWEKEIVHRDFKPDNIIISNKTQKPIIIDLGIARDLSGESLTKTIYNRGPCTEAYAAPEQLRNDKNIISPRTDFFAIGIVALELYYKINPFSPVWTGSGLSIADNILNDNYRTEIKENNNSEAFLKIIKKMIEHEPYNRYRKYQSLQNDMIKFIEEVRIYE